MTIGVPIHEALSALARAVAHLGNVAINQAGGTFLTPGSPVSVTALICSLLLAAYLAVPRGRRTMPRLAVWRRALFPRRIWRSASGRADIAWFAVGLVFSGMAFGWAILSSEAIATGVERALTDGIGAVSATMPDIVVRLALTLVVFLAYEFAYWFDHFLCHRVPLLWHFHRVHHAAESLSLFTNFRVHPVDTVLFYNIVAMTVGVAGGVARWSLGPGAEAFTIGGTNALVMLCAVGVTNLQHSHLWVRFGPRWGRWFLGPAHHQIHHSTDPRHFDRNLGSTLAIWDRLFGTFHMPAARREALRFGVDDAAGGGAHGVTEALVTPVARAVATVTRIRVGGR